MNTQTMDKILRETAYVRQGGTIEEKRCAEYLQEWCTKLGVEAHIETFPVNMYDVKTASLTVDGREIPCRACLGCANGTVEGELYYITDTSTVSLENCKDKIVLSDRWLGAKTYTKLVEHGAKALIVSTGDFFEADPKPVEREQRFETTLQERIPGVTIHIREAADVVRMNGRTARLTLEHTSYEGDSYNVIADCKGDSDETVILSAHLDSVWCGHGAYDNMSCCIALLYLMEYFRDHPHHRTIRFLFCGSEERGLLGSAAYCDAHADDLGSTVLNINLDLLGAVLGSFEAFACVNEEMEAFIRGFFEQRRYPTVVKHDIRSSDSNSFLKHNVPAVSFARYTPPTMKCMHTRYDTVEVLDVNRLAEECAIITEFVEYMANIPQMPVNMEISDKIREALQPK